MIRLARDPSLRIRISDRPLIRKEAHATIDESKGSSMASAVAKTEKSDGGRHARWGGNGDPG